MNEIEVLYQIINRLGALVEQYDVLDQSYAQIEMQKEVLERVPSSKKPDGVAQQIQESLSSAEAHRDALLRAVRDITGKPFNELRPTVTNLKLALQKFSEVELDFVKTKQAFDILADTDGFDPEEGQGGSRKEYAAELENLNKNRQYIIAYLQKITNNALNKQALVTPTDSVLGPIIRQLNKEN